MTAPLHIAIATPMYGGACMGEFASSVMALKAKLASMGHKCGTIFPGNESLIPRARNMIAALFLEHPSTTHLLFIDADIVFRPHDIVRMIEADVDVIMAPVPLKMFDWERVAAAARRGVPAQELQRYGGVFNFVPRDGDEFHDADKPFKIKMGGTGLMLIKRGVFETLAPMISDYAHQLPGGAMAAGVRIKNFFPVEVVDDDLLSEDYGFCRLWRKAGGTIWCAPWCEIGHMGTYKFTGVYRDCYQIEPKPEASHEQRESADAD